LTSVLMLESVSFIVLSTSSRLLLETSVSERRLRREAFMFCNAWSTLSILTSSVTSFLKVSSFSVMLLMACSSLLGEISTTCRDDSVVCRVCALLDSTRLLSTLSHNCATSLVTGISLVAELYTWASKNWP